MALVHAVGPIKDFFNVFAWAAMLLLLVRLFGPILLKGYFAADRATVDSLIVFSTVGIGAVVPAAILFEYYYANWCPVNQYLQDQVKEVAQQAS